MVQPLHTAPMQLRTRLPTLHGLRTSETGLLALAVLVGAGAGLGAVAFRWLVDTMTLLFSGQDDYADAGHAR